MKTKFKLIFKCDTAKEKCFNNELQAFKKSLPSTFTLEKEKDDFFISIETKKEEDHSVQYLIDRELDKYFFLTHIEISAEIITKYTGKPFVSVTGGYGSLHDNISPQKWNYNLPLQLRLWRRAYESDNFRLRMLYYFQIIELFSPTYPPYADSANPPHPRTECKYLRHLIAHAGEVTSSGLKKYCHYLQIPELMFDETDSEYQRIISNKESLLKEQAMCAIEEQLTGVSDRNKRGFMDESIYYFTTRPKVP